MNGTQSVKGHVWHLETPIRVEHPSDLALPRWLQRFDVVDRRAVDGTGRHGRVSRRCCEHVWHVRQPPPSDLHRDIHCPKAGSDRTPIKLIGAHHIDQVMVVTVWGPCGWPSCNPVVDLVGLRLPQTAIGSGFNMGRRWRVPRGVARTAVPLSGRRRPAAGPVRGRWSTARLDTGSDAIVAAVSFVSVLVYPFSHTPSCSLMARMFTNTGTSRLCWLLALVSRQRLTDSGRSAESGLFREQF